MALDHDYYFKSYDCMAKAKFGWDRLPPVQIAHLESALHFEYALLHKLLPASLHVKGDSARFLNHYPHDVCSLELLRQQVLLILLVFFPLSPSDSSSEILRRFSIRFLAARRATGGLCRWRVLGSAELLAPIVRPAFKAASALSVGESSKSAAAAAAAPNEKRRSSSSGIEASGSWHTSNDNAAARSSPLAASALSGAISECRYAIHFSAESRRMLPIRPPQENRWFLNIIKEHFKQ